MRKKTILVFAVILLVLSNTTACSNVIPNDKANIVDSIQKRLIKLNQVEFECKDLDSWELSKGLWYDESNILLAFKTSGREKQFKLVSFNMSNNESSMWYKGKLSVEGTDRILYDGENIGYQNGTNTVVFDLKTEKLVKELTKSKEDISLYFSTDMNYMAGVRTDGLYIVNNTSGEAKMADNKSQAYSGLTWADDNSKLVYVSDNNSDINIIDNLSNKKQVLCAGKNFQLPRDWVALNQCRFLPNNNDVLVHCMGKNSDSFILINPENNEKSRIISESGQIRLLEVSDSLIVYVFEEKGSEKQKLIGYNYVNNTVKVIHETTAKITCASFSPDYKTIFFGIYSHGENQLYTYHVK